MAVSRILLLYLVLSSVGCILSAQEELSDQDRKALLQAIAAWEEMGKQAQRVPPPERLIAPDAQTAQSMEQALAPADATHGFTRAELVDQLKTMTTSLLGSDTIQATILERTTSGAGRDPSGEQTFKTGKAGLLWAFWAMDAPGVELLANQLSRVSTAHPDLAVYDLHVMRLSDWNHLLRELSRLKDLLAQVDPVQSPEVQYRAKLALREQALRPYLAATQLIQTRRYGGLLLVEDMTPAERWRVQEIPSFVYVSPDGIVHRIVGLHADQDLVAWMARCQQWERENREVLEVRRQAIAP